MTTTPEVKSLVVITAGLSVPSSTRLLSDRMSAAVTTAFAERKESPSVQVIELREHSHALADRLVTGFATDSLRQALEAVEEADAVIAVTPVFSASYSGLFKLFFDVLDKDALIGKPVLLGATAGTSRHSLVIDHAMRPLFAYLRATVVPTGVFAASEDWAGPTGVDAALGDRINRAAGELVNLTVGRVKKPPVQQGGVDVIDAPFGGTPTFASLLHRAQ